MSIDDVVILTMTLGSAIGGGIAIRRTFRHPNTVRDAVVSPSIFAVVGGLVGLSIGMIWLSNQDGSVKLDKGVPLLVSGLCVGLVVGAGVRAVYSRMGRGKPLVFVLVVTLLAGSIGAPIGWVAGFFKDVAYSERLNASRMRWGAVIGSGVGLGLGLSEVVFRRRGAT